MMEKEEHDEQQQQEQEGAAVEERKGAKRYVLTLNCLLLGLGGCGGPLVSRLYFVHGGKRVWLSSCLETAGWPFLLIPFLISYLRQPNFVFMKPRLLFSAALVGFLTGFDDYLYAYGVARLPLSTSALIIATQLAFTAAFAFLLVKQKFTSYSINAVVLLTIGGAVLAMHTSADRPAGESTKQYIAGFLMTLGAAMLYGFVLPLVELTYNKAGQPITYTLVLQFQLIMSLFATIVCTVGMFINNDFKVIPREAAEFGLGETKYYVVLVCTAIFWQCFFLGAIGVIFSSSSLFSGIIIAVLLPVTETLGVLIFKEKFQVEKGISLILSLWGFVSYFYGEIKHNKKKKKLQQLQPPTTIQITNV